MVIAMLVGMAVLGAARMGHGWAGTLEMAGVMSAPAVALAPLSWAGVISGDSLMIVTHVAMVPLMLAAMLRRRSEYAR